MPDVAKRVKDSPPFGFAIQRSLVTLMRTEESRARS